MLTQLCLFAIYNSHLSTIAVHLFLLLSNSSVQQVCFGISIWLFVTTILPSMHCLVSVWGSILMKSATAIFAFYFFFLDLDLVVENPVEKLGCGYWCVCFLHSGEVGELKVSFFNYIY